VILADTSIWIDHLRSGDAQLQAELMRDAVLMHPFIAAELALGSLRNHTAILQEIDSLPSAIQARDEEARQLIEQRALFGRGIGFVDAHLLASVLITPHTLLWTRDRRLRTVAESLAVHVSFE
jgi:predicted nucleic acid-binding protein